MESYNELIVYLEKGDKKSAVNLHWSYWVKAKLIFLSFIKIYYLQV